MNEQANCSYDNRPSITREILSARPEQSSLQLIWDMTFGLMPSNYSVEKSLTRIDSLSKQNQSQITEITSRIPELGPFYSSHKKPLEEIQTILDKLNAEKTRINSQLDSNSLQILEYFVAQKVLKLLEDLYSIKVSSLMIANRGVNTAINSQADPNTKARLQSILTTGFKAFAAQTPEAFLISTSIYTDNTPPSLIPIVTVLRDIAKTRSELSLISTTLKEILGTLVDTTTSADASKKLSDGDSVVTDSFRESSEMILDEQAKKAAQYRIDSILAHIALGEGITPQPGSLLDITGYFRYHTDKSVTSSDKNTPPKYDYYVIFSEPNNGGNKDLHDFFSNPLDQNLSPNSQNQQDVANAHPRLTNLAIFKRILIDTGFCDAFGVDTVIAQFRKELRIDTSKQKLPVMPDDGDRYRYLNDGPSMEKIIHSNGNCVFTREISLKTNQTDKPTNTETIIVEFSKNGNDTYSLVKLEIGSSGLYNNT